MAIGGGDPSSRKIGPSDFPANPWPLSVAGGTLRCRPAGAVTFTPVGSSMEYAVNGTARASGRYWDIEPIWRANPSPLPGDGPKVSIGPLITAGLALCE